jgi:hypothetical protein
MVLGTFSVELSWLNIRQEARDKKISALFPKSCEVREPTEYDCITFALIILNLHTTDKHSVKDLY